MRKGSEACPPQVTSRLSSYLRCLTRLESEGSEWVSSGILAEQLHPTASQIRRDLARFGEFGIRGVGYRVSELRHTLRRILGLDRGLGLVVIGAGRLGMALADYPGFHQEGMEMVAVFDVDPERVGVSTRSGVTVQHLDRLLEVRRREDPEIAIIAVPPERAQEVADAVVEVGIRAILNFAPVPLRVPRAVRVNAVDLKTQIESLSFFLKQPPVAKAGPLGRGG